MLILRSLLWVVMRVVLSLRYHVHLVQKDQIQGLQGPTLLLPNHPGYADPMLLWTHFYPRLRPRPVMAEITVQNPLFGPFVRLLRPICIPELKEVNVEARRKTSSAIDESIQALKNGENVLLWPAGRLQRRGIENLASAVAVTEILKGAPEANVVLVRTRGVWGSSFSFAPTGHFPSLTQGLLRGLLWLLANLLVFMPRRRVTVTLQKVDRSSMPELERAQINRWLEQWYNAEGPEKPTYVPYHFVIGARTYEFPPLATLNEADVTQVRPETKDKVAQIVLEKIGRPLTGDEKVAETLLDDLGLDSLSRMDVTLEIERQFGQPSRQMPVNLGQLWALAQGMLSEREIAPVPAEWFRLCVKDRASAVLGSTVSEAFVRRAFTQRKDVVAADDRAGVLTYEKMLVAVLVFSKRCAALPEKHIGLLLPASVASDITFLALHLAGKIPVILNWTTGAANVAHAIQLTKLQHVLTSREVIQRLGVDLPNVEPVYLEDLRTGIGTWEKLTTMLSVRWFPGKVMKKIPSQSPHDPAAILFTSGSEKAPKAVPLTHENVLSNVRAALEVVPLTSRDAVLGFLPAFHSFGLTVTGLLTLLSGVRVVRHPNPTESAKLVQKIASYKPTIVLATPTFLSHLLQRVEPGDLDSLRLIVVGAEKCPSSVRERCDTLAPNAQLLEGYGVTECSPVVCLNRPDQNRVGTVGQALPGLDLLVMDLETREPVPPGQQGMLWVSGPSVFPGYLGEEVAPFEERNGKRWYVTGDVVEMDEEGYVTIKGRLKRFVKIGGEMISLPALEEPLSQLYPATDEGPQVAVEAQELEQGAHVVLFSTQTLTLLEANNRLKEAGFHGVMRFSEVRQVEVIPTLGTGKTDYRSLRAQLESAEPDGEQKEVQV